MKLNKTQVKLLREGATNRHGLCFTESYGGHGAGGGTVSGGGRSSSAACKLRDAGFLVFDKHEESRNIKNGWHMVITTGIWHITDAGRAAIAAHDAAEKAAKSAGKAPSGQAETEKVQ